VQQPHHPGLPLDERADRRPLGRADDEVALRKSVGGPGGRVLAETDQGPGGPGVDAGRLAVRSLTGNVRPAFWGALAAD